MSQSKTNAPLSMTDAPFDRVIWIVLDGVGAGELPDAQTYGDTGSDTLGNLARETAKRGAPLKLEHLAAWGIGNLTPMQNVPPRAIGQGEGAYGRAIELSSGKDTTSGHWEMAGLVVSKAFTTYPNGFSAEVVERWCRENNLPGVLGNKSASGTEILLEYGEEHLRSGKPILYTSADSVWQVAAHETAFGLERLYTICKSARKIGDELQLGRVIARPFVGDPAKGTPFKRTYNRKDYAQIPFARTYLDLLVDKKITTQGIGKISSIFAGRGVSENIDTEGNTDGIRVLLEQMKTRKQGLIFCNLIDFDMLYGHRRDVDGFGRALEEFDRAVPALKALMSPRDLLVITADHGNDPTFPGTDHTREYIPVICYSPAQKTAGPADLGKLGSFGDIGASIVHALTGMDGLRAGHNQGMIGETFLGKMGLG